MLLPIQFESGRQLTGLDLSTIVPPTTVLSKIAQATTRRAIADIRAGNSAAAISSLTAVVESTGDWTCQFWLAVAFLRSGAIRPARHQFLFLAEKCPDFQLRKAAMNMLLVIERNEAS